MSCATVDITLNYLCKYWEFFLQSFLKKIHLSPVVTASRTLILGAVLMSINSLSIIRAAHRRMTF